MSGRTRKPLSNYEGFRRLDVALGKLEAKQRATQPRCQVCGRRCRAWRMVPSVDGEKRNTKAPMTSKVLLCCDSGPESCAAKLERAGEVERAVQLQKLEDEFDAAMRKLFQRELGKC